MVLQRTGDVTSSSCRCLDSWQWSPDLVVPGSTQPYVRVSLQPTADEYKTVESMFMASMASEGAVMQRIEKVENPNLLARYQSKKAALSERLSPECINEVQAFHGTTPDCVDGICKSSVIPYGKGAYFAWTAIRSHCYTEEDADGLRYMILSHVMLGYWTVGEPRPLKPGLPVILRGHHLTHGDSAIDQAHNPHVFVTWDQYQSYPSYVIVYRAPDCIHRQLSVQQEVMQAMKKWDKDAKKRARHSRRRKDTASCVIM
ncbi:protein mono-ADP-ribosyltransferase TIPARP-like [Branchiostoma floridae x Branchiostoma belcheri]